MLLPGAVSTLSAELLSGPVRPGRVAGRFPSALYVLLDVDGEARVLPLLAPDALRLPVGVLVPGASAQSWPPDDACFVGRGRVLLGSWEIRGVRQWAPEQIRAVGRPAPHLDDARVERAVLPIAGGIGLGPGLTPLQDDLACGAALALRALGCSRVLAAFDGRVRAALARTTTVSAELLRAALGGHGLAPVLGLARAVGADDPAEVRRHLPDVLAVGHTSGAGLVEGMAVVAHAAGLDVREDLDLHGSRPRAEEGVLT